MSIFSRHACKLADVLGEVSDFARGGDSGPPPAVMIVPKSVQKGGVLIRGDQQVSHADPRVDLDRSHHGSFRIFNQK